MEAMAKEHRVYPIFSFAAASTDSRFGKAEEFLAQAEAICGRPVIRTIADAEPIGPRDLWCDDSGHPAYNQWVQSPFAASQERLRRPDPLYDLVLVTDWNWPAARVGQGSAIFLHRWRRPGYPTAGCVAFAPEDLAWIAERIRPGTRLIVR